MKKPLKILYFLPDIDFGGAEAVLLNFLGKFDRTDFEPLIVTGGEGTFTEALDRAGIPRCSIRPVQSSKVGFSRVLLNFFPNLIRIWKILEKEKPDLIHDMIPDGLMYLSFAARLNKIPLLWHPHIPEHQVRKRGRVIQKLCVRIKLDFVIFISDYARKSYSSFPRTRWAILPNSVNLNDLMQHNGRELRRKYQLTDETKLIGLVARVIPGKGHEAFLEAAGRLARHFKDLRFLIIGDTDIDPTFTGKLRRMVKDLGLGETVRFTGFLSPPGGCMVGLDVLALPSHSEMQGLVLLEAMACGIPVVASDIEATREVIEDGETGLLVPPGDAESLAKALLRMIEDRELRNRLSRNGLAKVKSHYSLETNTCRLAEIYHALCSGKSRSTDGL